jgi:hypothetical protein
VAVEQVAQALFQGLAIQQALERQYRAQVINRAARIQLLEKP